MSASRERRGSSGARAKEWFPGLLRSLALVRRAVDALMTAPERVREELSLDGVISWRGLHASMEEAYDGSPVIYFTIGDKKWPTLSPIKLCRNRWRCHPWARPGIEGRYPILLVAPWLEAMFHGPGRAAALAEHIAGEAGRQGRRALATLARLASKAIRECRRGEAVGRSEKRAKRAVLFIIVPDAYWMLGGLEGEEPPSILAPDTTRIDTRFPLRRYTSNLDPGKLLQLYPGLPERTEQYARCLLRWARSLRVLL